MGAEQRVVSLDDAFARAQRGNLIYADIVARACLQHDPGNLGALNLLGLVAVRAGAVGQALAVFRRAASLAPAGAFDATLARIEAMEPAWRQRRERWRGEERYLLIKAWGAGFCSEVNALVGALLLAEITHRTPVIHWGSNSLFGDGTPQNCFPRYFEPLNGLTLADMRAVAAGIYPAKWTAANLEAEEFNKAQGPDSRLGGLYFLERDEKLAVLDFVCNVVDIIGWIPPDHPYHGLSIAEIYRLLWQKYLRPSQAVRENIEAFAAARWPEGPVLAVHVRDGDKWTEVGNLREVNAAYPERIDAFLAGRDWPIFLMTDSTLVLDAFRARYGARAFSTNAQRTSDNVGVHFQAVPDRLRLGVEMLTDLMLAMRADAFLGNGRSNPSCTIALLKEWPQNACELAGSNFLLERSLFLYDF